MSSVLWRFGSRVTEVLNQFLLGYVALSGLSRTDGVEQGKSGIQFLVTKRCVWHRWIQGSQTHPANRSTLVRPHRDRVCGGCDHGVKRSGRVGGRYPSTQTAVDSRKSVLCAGRYELLKLRF